MVGRQYFKRCGICRKRKLKCDEAKPACGQCQSAGWHCPGYVRTWDFRQVHGSANRCTGKPSEEAASRSGSHVGKEASAFQRCLPTTISPTPVKWSSSDRLCQALCWSIDHNRVSAALTVLPCRPYVCILPQLVGLSAVLDSAIGCIVQTYHEQQSRTDKYVQAIHSLRLELDRIGTQPDFNTITAILVLQMFENHQRPGSKIASMHAEGYVRAVVAAGPDAFTDTVSQLVLTAGLGFLCSSSLQQPSGCFLEQPEWQALLQQQLPNTDPTVSLMRELAVHIAKFPRLMSDFRSHCTSLSLRAGTVCAKRTLDIAESLTQRLDCFRAELQPWLAERSCRDITLNVDCPSFSDYTQLLVAFNCLGSASLLVTMFMLEKLANHETNPLYLQTLLDFGSGAKQQGPSEQKDYIDDIKQALLWLNCFAPHTCRVVQQGIAIMANNVVSCCGSVTSSKLGLEFCTGLIQWNDTESNAC